MKFIITTDRDGKGWLLNRAHIVAVTPRSGKGHDWDKGALIYLTKDQDAVVDPIAVDEKQATRLLKDLL